MKISVTMVIAGAIGLVVLCGCLASSYLRAPDALRAERHVANASPLTERQRMERRRGYVGVVAVAGTTAR